MPAVSMMIKPASAGCDLRCRYCFYADEAAHRAQGVRGRMTRRTAALCAGKALEYARGGPCSFVFQGGEPSLAGLNFFEDFVRDAEAANTARSPLHWSFQTNGYSLDDAWAAFFARHGFLVGVSIDGAAAVHDALRPAAGGAPSHAVVLKNLRRLRRFGGECNTLTVVTKQLAANVGQAYAFFRDEGIAFQQYIPCMDPLEGTATDCSLTPKTYARFLHRLFLLWKEDLDRGRYLSIRHFDNWMGILAGRPPESCNMLGVCSPQFVVEADGSVYPCDFYCLDQWLLGNIAEGTLAEMEARSRALGFVERSLPVPEECRRCPWYPLCRNGCPRDRDRTGKTRYCEAHREFFSLHARDLAQAARTILVHGLQPG